MSWYRQIFASREDYLRSLGVADNLIAFVNSVPPENAQFYINLLRANPHLTLQQLQSQQPPKVIQPYTKEELALANSYKSDPRFYTWVLVNLRKIRISGSGWDWLDGVDIYDAISRIRDWYRALHIDIASYDIYRSWKASEEWHEQFKQGGNLKYEEKNIIYGPQWNNEKWNGWTVQIVNSENDLNCEGEKMGHCVGSYADEVSTGSSIIFSLRDPRNEPHVTIEVKGVSVQQIQGKGNSEPKDEYKKMVAEWIQSSDSAPKYQDYSQNFEPIHELIKHVNNRDISDTLDKINSTDEYGLKSNISYEPEEVFGNIESELSNRGRNYDAPPYTASIAQSIVNLFARFNGISELDKYVEKMLYKHQDSLADWAYMNCEKPAPDEDAFPDQASFEVAQQKWYEEYVEPNIEHAWKHTLPFALIYYANQILSGSREPSQP